MKESPDQQALREKLLPGKISAEGFLGNDSRSPHEIILDDEAAVTRLGVSHAAIAGRMQGLTEAGKAGLGRPVLVENRLQVTVIEVMGQIPCPFSDNFHADKRVTRVVDQKTGRTASWSDLNLHMIGSHGFYEGHGSFFRVDPAEIVAIIGIPNAAAAE